MNKAIFLDRDGTINIQLNERIVDINQIELIPKVAEAIKKMNQEFLVIIITNQAVVSLGLATKEKVEEINEFIRVELEKQGARIDAIYYCPCHPSVDEKCECRKPKPKMVLDAAKKYNIDLSKSFFVGDQTADLLCGKNAGVKSFLVETGYAGKDGVHEVKPDFTVKDLLEAADSIIDLSK